MSQFLNLMHESKQDVDTASIRRVAINSIGKVNLPKDSSDAAYDKFFDDVTAAVIDNVVDKEMSIILLDEIDYCKAAEMTPYRVIRALQNKITNYKFVGESMSHKKESKPICESFGYDNYIKLIDSAKSELFNFRKSINDTSNTADKLKSANNIKSVIDNLIVIRDDIVHEMGNEINAITIQATGLLSRIDEICKKFDPSYVPKDYNESLKESVMTPTPVPYTAAFTNVELQPLVVFALFGKDNKPLLNSRGVIITSKMSETFNQDYANSLYVLISNLKEVYVLDNAKYNEAADIRTDEEFYKFVKANGELLKDTSADGKIHSVDMQTEETLFDDTDFIIQ